VNGTSLNTPQKADSNLGLIIGLALGLPCAALTSAILVFFHWQRSNKSWKRFSGVTPYVFNDKKCDHGNGLSNAPSRYRPSSRPTSEIDSREVRGPVAELSPSSEVPLRYSSVVTSSLPSRPVSAVISPPGSVTLSIETGGSTLVSPNGSGRDHSEWSPRLSHARWSGSTATGGQYRNTSGNYDLPPLAELPG
jgi:hypothetical protein